VGTLSVDENEAEEESEGQAMNHPQQRISPGAAALLSFLLPGLGQACQGRLGAAAFVFGMVSVMYVFAVLTVGLGLVVALPCHVVAGLTLGLGLVLAIPAHLIAVVHAASG
jgi:hypothetical protein